MPFDPRTLPRLDVNPFRWIDRFTIPANGDAGLSTFDYGGFALGMSGANRGLYLAGNDQANRMGEISVAAGGAQARVLLSPIDLPNARARIGDDAKPGGALVYKDRTYISAYSYYNANGRTLPSHAWYNGANTNWRYLTTQGQRIGGGRTAGYMSLLPPEWADYLGYPAITGQGGIPIISQANSGPGCYAFNPEDLLSGDAPCRVLLDYPLDHPLEPTQEGRANATWQRNDMLGCGFVVPNTRTLLFIGVHGNGPFHYGEPTKQYPDPVNGNKGDHAYPYFYTVWAYDLAEILAAAQPWQPKPYAQTTLPTLPGSSAAFRNPGAATFDPVQRRLYVVPRYSTNGTVEVFETTVGAPPVVVPEPEPEPTPTPEPEPPAPLPTSFEATVDVWAKIGDVDYNAKAAITLRRIP